MKERRGVLGRMSPLQWFLSAFVVYHLFAVMITPLLLPPFGERLGAWVQPYVTTFEFTNLWEFFSPNPAVPMLISWEADDASGRLVSEGVWPRIPRPGVINDEEVRRLAALYFMVGSDEYIEKMMVPHLCAQDGRFHAVRLWKESHPVPSLMEEGFGRPAVEGSMERKFVAHAFCESQAGNG